jgi:hypothetical protein
VAEQSYLVRVGSRVGERGAGELRITQLGIGCPCDWNGVGGLTMQDLFDFLTDWFAGNADYDSSGATDVGDLLEFVGCFLGEPPGCGG